MFPGQRSNQSCSFWPTPQPWQHQIQAASATYVTACSKARSLTHWVRPGIEPAVSWMLVGFVFTAPWRELLVCLFTCPSRSLLHIQALNPPSPQYQLVHMPQAVFSRWNSGFQAIINVFYVVIQCTHSHSHTHKHIPEITVLGNTPAITRCLILFTFFLSCFN